MESEKKKTKKAETIVLDEDTINTEERIPVDIAAIKEEESVNTTTTLLSQERDNLVNCLKNEKIIVRFISRAKGMVTDPRHVLYGGMAEGSRVLFTTPLLRSGGYADVLTKNEKKFLEYKLGLEANALSVHNRTNNFWSDANEQGIGRIELKKGDNPLDLSNPIDYSKVETLIDKLRIISYSFLENELY